MVTTRTIHIPSKRRQYSCVFSKRTEVYFLMEHLHRDPEIPEGSVVDSLSGGGNLSGLITWWNEVFFVSTKKGSSRNFYLLQPYFVWWCSSFDGTVVTLFSVWVVTSNRRFDFVLFSSFRSPSTPQEGCRLHPGQLLLLRTEGIQTRFESSL